MTHVPDDLEVQPSELEAALRASGKSASALARALHVDSGTVSRWRRGVMKLSRSRFVAVLAVLGLPLDWRAPAQMPATDGKTKGRPRTRRR